MIFMSNLKKISVLIILYFILFNVNSYSEIVNKVEVKGNNRISSETIMVFGDISIGKNYQGSDVNLLIKKLYESNFFSNISVELKNNKLTIVVEENPLIDSIILDGEKAAKNKDKISELISLREKSAFTENSIKRDINIIKTFYRTLGFYFVKIDTTVEKLERNKVKIVFSIDKGKKAKISVKYFYLINIVVNTICCI